MSIYFLVFEAVQRNFSCLWKLQPHQKTQLQDVAKIQDMLVQSKFKVKYKIELKNIWSFNIEPLYSFYGPKCSEWNDKGLWMGAGLKFIVFWNICLQIPSMKENVHLIHQENTTDVSWVSYNARTFPLALLTLVPRAAVTDKELILLFI